jgi:hypothetical protein
MKKVTYILLFLVMLMDISCMQEGNSEKSDGESYTFFVAGHVYGYRWVDNKGFHPPFREQFSLINERDAEVGVLLGDIVFECTEEDWEEVDSVLQYLEATTYLAVGNHDLVDRPLFESRYGRTYYSFIHRNDLFIVLDPYLDHWNISGEQLEFLKRTLSNHADDVRNIYVFFHQLLWWAKDNKYREVTVNSLDERADSINFWTEIEPMFHKTEKPVYMFAGDLGAGNWVGNYFYDTYDNITFVATGMGNDNEDNFIIVHVDGNGSVRFEMISLMGDDIHGLGKLEDYILP